MTSRIFRSICLAALGVLLAALVLIMGVLYSYFTRVQFDQLRTETALTAHAVANQGLSFFDGLEDTGGCRITWIGADGSVLYDSQSDYSGMENHLQREEVRQALAEGYGESARYSDTLMARSIYAAQRLPDGTVVRLSASQGSILTLALGMAQPICVVIAVALVLSLVLASRLAKNIVKPLNELNLDDPLSNREYEEIQPLLHRLSSQQSQLRAQARELSLRQKEFSAVTRSLNEGLVLLNPAGVILSINPAAARLLGVTPYCAGADFRVANQNPEISALVARAADGEKAEQVLSFPAGDFQVSASPVKTEETISGVVLLLLDVTQKRQAEQLRREFTANVSHELKTPLHAISGYAELLKSGLVRPEDVPGFSDKIYGEAQRLIQLVEDILRLSRLDEGAGDLPRTEVDLYDAAEQTVQSLSSAAELCGVTLTFSGTHGVIQGIPQLISGILYNLTDNAIKYNRPGGSVAVRVEDLPEGVRLTVADTGIGIPPEDRERVFERFYRVDKSRSKEVGGTGLGLSIVKHAALIHNARIDLTSTPGKGTTITVTFPK